MKNYSSASAYKLSVPSPQDITTYYVVKYAALIYLLLGLICQTVHGDDSIIHRTGYGSYGIINRMQKSSKRVIFQPMDGAFNEGFEVSYYDFKGQVICKGRIQSIYRDEIYTNAEDCDKFDNISPGMGVAFNGDTSDMLEIYKNREKLEGTIIDREWNRFPGVPKDLSEEQYQKMVLKSSVPVLVEFYVTWCPYCTGFVSVLGEIANDFSGKVRVATIDVEKNKTLADEYKVKKYPSLFLLKDGKVVDSWTGAYETKAPVITRVNNKLQ